MSAIINPFAFGAGGGNGGFDPTTISGCSMWVSADDPLLSGLNDGDPVGGTTPWTDRVTGTRVFSNPIVGDRPVKKLNIVNGKPVIRFDATNDRLEFSVPSSNIVTASAFTIFIVVKPDRNGTTSGTEAGANLLTSIGYWGIVLFDSGGGTNKFRFYRFNGGYVGVNSTTTYSTGSWYIVECWYDGTDLRIKVNNDAEATQAASNPQQLTDHPSISGATAIGSDVAEEIVANVTWNSTDRTTVREALADKYGITLA